MRCGAPPLGSGASAPRTWGWSGPDLAMLPTHVGMDQHPARCRKTCSVFPTHVGIPVSGCERPGAHVSSGKGSAAATALPLPFFVVLCCFLWCCAGLGCRWLPLSGNSSSGAPTPGAPTPGNPSSVRPAETPAPGVGESGAGKRRSRRGHVGAPVADARHRGARAPGPPRRRLAVRPPMPCLGTAGSAAGWTR